LRAAVKINAKLRRKRRIHLHGAVVHLTFPSFTSICELRRSDAAHVDGRSPQT
jgi:hypothetical protein